jgi:hypothetical protein
MNSAFAAVFGASILGLVLAAHAETRMQLTDWQLDAVVAGGGLAIATFETSAAGQSTAIQTSVENIAVTGAYGGVAQSRAAVLATAAGDASIASIVANQSEVGQDPAQVATASTAGSASGDKTTLQSVDVTTAVSASGPLGRSSMGFAAALANVTAFSASGRWH